MEKKSLILNCDVCDSRNMKEEDYRQYETVTINSEVLIVNEVSKGMLLRLSVRQNIERTLECEEETDVRIVNGAYEITADRMPQKPVILVANGPLKVMPGTETVLGKYKCLIINGPAEFPESLTDFMNNMTVNGKVTTYPDDHVILGDDFVMDQYFPLRAVEGKKYFARNAVIIQDADVDIAELLQKHIHIRTPRLIVPESRIEECSCLFDADVDFVVVPEGMALVCGDAVLDEELIRRKGRRLFVYGHLELKEDEDMEMIRRETGQLVVTGSVSLYRHQKEEFQKLDARYEDLRIKSQERVLQGMVTVHLNKKLFDHSPDGIRIGSAVKVVIEEDVTPEMIMDGLNGINCLQIECSEEQREALDRLNPEYGMMPPMLPMSEEKAGPGMPGEIASLIVNAESYVM